MHSASLERDAVLGEALPWLKAQGIWSRGRFGSYKYEVANQDHSCMVGVEAVDNMLFGTKEFTLLYPSLVSSDSPDPSARHYVVLLLFLLVCCDISVR